MFEKEENATITSTRIETEDHGIPTLWINFDFGGGGQGFGGYDARFEKHALWPYEIIKVLEVKSWESLPGTNARIRRDKSGMGGKIIAIGHIVKDRWLEVPE